MVTLDSRRTKKQLSRQKTNLENSNKAARYGKSWKNIVFVEMYEFSELIEKLELSITAAEQEDPENARS